MGILLVLAFGLGLGGIRQTAADHWPRFRGPNGTGLATDREVPVRWNMQQDVLWKTHLPGAGNSSPVIWDNRVFIESATSKERLLLCLDAAKGKILWQRSMAGTIVHKHPKNSFASSTPATDGERVYAVFWDGRHVFMSAYDFRGNRVWSRDLGSFKSQHGVGASPVVHGGKVFLNKDQDGAAVLVALDARTGAVAWQAKRRAFRACYSTPFVRMDEAGKPELVVASTAGITGYDPDDGREKWTWTWHFANMPLRTVGSPICHNGIVFAASGDGSGERHTVAVKAGGQGDVTRTNLLWEKKRDFPYVPTMLVQGEYLFYVNDRGMARCHVARTGATVWEKRLEGPVTASPLLIDGKIYAINEKGDVYVLAAAGTFKHLAKNSVGESVFASPAVAGSRLYIRGDTHLFCIGKRGLK
jgi:outer membrane protein assembly factor BamB